MAVFGPPGVPRTLAQAGSVGSPTPITHWTINLRDSSRGPFQQVIGGGTFLDTFDPALYWGYNVAPGNVPVVAGEPTATIVIEADYEVSAGVHHLEMYFEAFNNDHDIFVRPFFAAVDRDTAETATYISAGPVTDSLIVFTGPDGADAYTDWLTLTRTQFLIQTNANILFVHPGATDYLKGVNNANTFQMTLLSALADDTLIVGENGDGSTWGHPKIRLQAKTGNLDWNGTALVAPSNLLTTSGNFSAGLSVIAADTVNASSGAAAGQIKTGAVGPSSKAGIVGGTGLDTILYRDAAHVWRTAESFVIDGGAGRCLKLTPQANPATCAVGELNIDASNRLNVCTATNTWTIVGSQS